MRSSLEYALLAAKTGTMPRRRNLDQLWAALRPFERAQLEREAGQLAGRGVRAAPGDGGWPLFHTGPYESIGRRVLAVCAPREAGPAATALAELAARAAVAAGAAVLAGDAEGPETAAVAAALAAGGLAVSVQAEGLGSAAGSRNRVAVSPSAPGQPWSMDAAMACNAAIARLCTALVAICAGSTGATVDAAMRALAAGHPVLAVGATAGSRLLVDYGATAAVDEVELMWWLDTRFADAGPRSHSTGQIGSTRSGRTAVVG